MNPITHHRTQTFLAFIRTYTKVFFHYRGAFCFTIVGVSVLQTLNAFFCRSIFAFNGTELIKGYQLSQMIWYFGATTTINTCIMNFTDNRLTQQIISGDLTTTLLRPVSLFQVELTHAISTRIIGITIEFIPLLIIQSLICYPDFLTIASFARFLALTACSFFLFFAINLNIGMLSFFMYETRALSAMKWTLFAFLGGALMPLEFFPNWLTAINSFLPFQYVYYWPIQFLLNRPETAQSFVATMGGQLCWIGLLMGLATVIKAYGLKRYCAAGS